jgi:hypothetical protein
MAPEKEVLTMCFLSNGMTVIGRVLGGGTKMLEPRMFSMFQEQFVTKGGQPVWLDREGNQTLVNTGKPLMDDKIQLKPLPSIPMFCYINGAALTYPVSEEILAGLYAKVTGADAYKPIQPPDKTLTGVSLGPEDAEVRIDKPLMGPRIVPGIITGTKQ